jgi:hypothetical protein
MVMSRIFYYAALWTMCESICVRAQSPQALDTRTGFGNQLLFKLKSTANANIENLLPGSQIPTGVEP